MFQITSIEHSKGQCPIVRFRSIDEFQTVPSTPVKSQRSQYVSRKDRIAYYSVKRNLFKHKSPVKKTNPKKSVTFRENLEDIKYFDEKDEESNSEIDDNQVTKRLSIE